MKAGIINKIREIHIRRQKGNYQQPALQLPLPQQKPNNNRELPTKNAPVGKTVIVIDLM